MSEIVGWTAWLGLLNEQLARDESPVKGLAIRLTPDSQRPDGYQYERTAQNDAAVSWALEQLRMKGLSTFGW